MALRRSGAHLPPDLIETIADDAQPAQAPASPSERSDQPRRVGVLHLLREDLVADDDCANRWARLPHRTCISHLVSSLLG